MVGIDQGQHDDDTTGRETGIKNALFLSTHPLVEIQPMSTSPTPEMRRYQRRGDPYPLYYSPEMALRVHDPHYLLRLISDRVARLAPDRFSLLPQFRSLDPDAVH